MATRIVAPGGATPATAPVEGVTKKRNNARMATKLPKGMSAQQLKDVAGDPDEVVNVPVLQLPYRKAPATDPYLRADSVTSEQVNVCGYALPPILRGIQPGAGLSGLPVDYSVQVIWISRRQIESMMAAVEEHHPELRLMLEVMRAFMCDLDTQRDEAKLGVRAALSWVKAAQPTNHHAIDQLEAVAQRLGQWNDERRLHLH